MRRTIKALFLTLLLLFIATTAFGAQITPQFLANVANGGCDWTVLNIARSEARDNYDAYINAQRENVSARYSANGEFSSSVTDTQRTVLALGAAGANVRDFGEYNGEAIDLLADATYNMNRDSVDCQGLTSAVYGLLALDCVSTLVPSDAKFTREDFINSIISYRLTDGGFTYWGESYDPDMTGMVLQALAPYKEQDNVKEIIDKAVELLAQNQLGNGDCSSWGTSNPESTAQVLIALCALGIDYRTDERFIKNSNTLLDGIEKYRLPDGTFSHEAGGDSNSFATYQANAGLIAAARFDAGKTSFYNYADTAVWRTTASFENNVATVYSDTATAAYFISAEMEDDIVKTVKVQSVELQNGKNEFAAECIGYAMLLDKQMRPLVRRIEEI
ncbi:MAG: terpene cyclase/mutase family protein [Clostridia bacterium]|nr:terpene cyclase/mutase family protein [Clostridia bacterium]